jgi:hypothetical protein
VAKYVFVVLLIATSAAVAQRAPEHDSIPAKGVMQLCASSKNVHRQVDSQPRDAVGLGLFVNATTVALAGDQGAPTQRQRQADGENWALLCEVRFGSSLLQEQTTLKSQSEGVSPHQAESAPPKDESEGKQSKRILWIIPNYRSVSANTELPPLTFKNKMWLATQDSFDYSSFALAGIVAGIGQARNSTPEFRQGAAGYGRYYWRSFADQALGNYLTEAFVPGATREDPRYYTLGHEGLFRRTGYSISRLLITRTDSGGSSFNSSEIVGNGAAAGISSLYYPTQERTWTKTGQKWLTQVAIDGLFNVFKEFWPDINRGIFHGHY